MKDNIILIFKGFLVGCGKVIPGVSGAMIAISLGIYDKAIHAILNIFNYKNIKYLAMIGIGLIVAVIIFSNIVLLLMHYYYVPVMFLFIGLISGGCVNLISESNLKKNYLFFIFPFLFLLILEFYVGSINIPKNFFTYILVGGIDALTMIIPGISGTAVLMIIDFYDVVLNGFSTINIEFLFPFFIGMIICALCFIKIIDILYNKRRDIFSSIVLGFAIGSIIILIMSTINYPISIMTLFISLFMFVGGIAVSVFLDSLKL